MMGEVVTGKVKTESMMQQSPGIFIQVNEEKGNGCSLGKEGNRTRIYWCSAGQGFLKKQAIK